MNNRITNASLEYTCSTHFVVLFFPEAQNYSRVADERFRDIPICESVCDAWWNACKHEYTCAEDWYWGFNTSGEGGTLVTGPHLGGFLSLHWQP